MGSVTIQKRKNVYQYKFEIASAEGKRKFLNKSGFRTKAEAIEAGQKAYVEYQNAGVPFKECKLSYSDYLDYWVKNYCETNLKYNTIQSYKVIIRKYIKPKLGMYKLTTLTSVKLNSFIAEMCNEYSFSKSYFKNILKVLKGSFRDACNIYGLIKYNPALTLRLPKMDIIQKEIKHLYTQEEINSILNRFKENDAFTCAFLTSCLTGMRTGEVFALRWQDIDFENRIINVKHNIYDKPKDDKGRWYIGTPKTISGCRKIHISPTLFEALVNFNNKQLKLKKLYGNKYINYHIEYVKNIYGKNIEERIVQNKNNEKAIDLIFTKVNGLYVGTDLLKYPFKIIHNELKIKCRFYDLRGTCATNILNSGVNIKNVADILGHKNVETTENYYISSIAHIKHEAVDNYDRLINSNTINEIIKYKV